ncbi:MAG: radical SAM family heme chaperone HemW [Candidatus Cloacimonetes bacterium]|nr:radical SAM family heme chaperone HemW [Candidatus Cloacimonadota bacterium]
MAMTKAIGIYVHIPFCIKRCAYCDFSTDLEKGNDRDRFLKALQKEIAASLYLGYSVNSIYFGGGTPSLLNPSELDCILTQIQSLFTVTSDCEVTLEGNPDSLTPTRISDFIKVGVNRFSVGIQTLNELELSALGRGHLVKENHQTIDALCRANVRFNVDLMMGIPHQTITSFKETLSLLPIEKISHVSAYLLSVEEESPWFDKINSGKIVLPAEGMEGEAYYLLKDFLEKQGIYQYEISAFSRVGQESIHNLKYWENENYLGFGPSAGSYFNQVRWQNQKSLSLYEAQLEGSIEKFHYEEYDSKNAILETIMLEFRKIKGICIKKLKKWSIEHPDLKIEEKIEKLLVNKKIEKVDSKIRITRESLLFANDIFMEFVE